MNAFEEKWNDAIVRARLTEKPIPTIPLGFAARVVKLSRESAEPIISWLASFERCVFKVAAAVGVAVAITGIFVAQDFLKRPSLLPAVENEVAEQFILL